MPGRPADCAAQYIANVYAPAKRVGRVPWKKLREKIDIFVGEMAAMFTGANGLNGQEVINEIRCRMSASAGHIRRLEDARAALGEAAALYRQIQKCGFTASSTQETIAAIQARHLALTSAAYLKAIVTLLEQDGGSRGSHLVLCEDGVELHSSVIDERTGRPMRMKKENLELRKSIIRVIFDSRHEDLFVCRNVDPRPAGKPPISFEPAWQDFREGKIYYQ